MNLQDTWTAAYNQLELQLDRATFDTWLRPATFIGLEGDIFVIGVHNSYAQDMLQHRLYRKVRRVVSDIRGLPTELRFDVVKAVDSNGDEQDDIPPLFKFMAQQKNRPNLPETSETQRATSLFKQVQQNTQQPIIENDLNPNYTFERFIVNQSNRVVYEAALAVAEYPATAYNPFFIYGNVGLGKTHLLQSIANVCQARGLRTLYIPSEIFTNELVLSIRSRTTAMFREKYRAVDVLLVDDVQFIAGKDTTQEEFFHTFNALKDFNKQVILVSDRHPSEMATLEDRLRSRFQGGLVAKISEPEYETRLAILQMWMRERNLNIEPHLLSMVAERAPRNIRELEGAFNQVIAQIRFSSSDTINMPSMVQQTLNRYEAPRERYSLEEIIQATADAFKLSYADLEGKKRAARINKARQVAMYLCRDLTENSLPQIGAVFGNRSHTTVLHGINKIEEEIVEDRVLSARINRIRRAISHCD